MFCITNYLHFKRIVMFIFRVTWICHTFCCRFSNFLHLSFTPCFYDEPRFCLFYHYCLWFCMSRFLLTVFFFSTAITRRLHGWWGVRSTIGWHLSLKVRGYYIRHRLTSATCTCTRPAPHLLCADSGPHVARHRTSQRLSWYSIRVWWASLRLHRTSSLLVCSSIYGVDYSYVWLHCIWFLISYWFE